MQLICRVLQLPRSTFYHQCSTSDKQADDQELTEKIRQIFIAHAGRYGYRRVWAELKRQGEGCGRNRVRRLMAQAGLRAIQPRSHRPCTSDGKASEPAPNLLLGKDLPSTPNQAWAADITFIPVAGGWVYLAIVLDLYTRCIVGWKLATHMRATLVVEALQQAVYQRQPPPGLILHSDRGSQYGSLLYRHEIAKIGARQSMSATGNPYHNAFVESAFGRFKTELLQNGHFCDWDDAYIEIFHHIETYYNRQRLHSALDYRTPEEFEAHYWLTINQQAA